MNHLSANPPAIRGTGLDVLATLGACACVLLFTVFAPYETDSPWLATGVSRYLSEGTMRLSGLLNDSIFGRLLLLADSWAYRLWPDYLATRWVQALSVLLLLPVCTNLVKRMQPGDSGLPGLIPVLFCLVMVSSGLLLDGRPEGVLVLLQTLTIWALLRYLDSARGVFLVLAAAFTAIGVETHPNGVLPSLYVAVALFMTRSALGWRTAGWVLLAAAVGTSIMALGLLWNKGLGPFLAALGETAGDGGHGHPPYKEYARYLSYFRRFPVHFVVIALGLAGLFGIGTGAPKASNARALRLVQACAVATLLFLVLMPSKWEHYVASLYPFALVGLSLQALALQRGLQRGLMLGAGIAIAFALMQSFLDNDAAHRLLKLPTERGRLLATLQEKVRGETVLGPVKMHFFMSTAADFQVTEGAPFQSLRHIPGLQWVILDPLVDLRRRQDELGYCLDYDMSVVVNRSYYNVFRTVPCQQATPPSH